MEGERNTVVQAFALARSGRFSSVEEIERELRKEGFHSVQQHLSGPTLRQQLRELIAESRAMA
jgi:hypothetical protein